MVTWLEPFGVRSCNKCRSQKSKKAPRHYCHPLRHPTLKQFDTLRLQASVGRNRLPCYLWTRVSFAHTCREESPEAHRQLKLAGPRFRVAVSPPPTHQARYRMHMAPCQAHTPEAGAAACSSGRQVSGGVDHVRDNPEHQTTHIIIIGSWVDLHRSG